ncbi:methyl-accepting chemotaxis protein [Azohydromonas lata]|uniref:methyl-accepting chemotaxis protein n=1 Tax=Azohydromonas lata TaxID=45677 RepID=UPI0009FD0B8B|nr:methyl-accepting chemotaxis protein [Azohydromonas lata]
MNFRNLTFKARLAAAFALMALLVAAVSVTALHALARERAGFELYGRGVAPRVELAQEVLAQAQARAVALRELLLAGTPKERQAATAAQTRAHQGVTEALQRLRKLLAQPGVGAQERSLYAGIESAEFLYGPLMQSAAALGRDGQREQALDKLNTARPLQVQLIQAVRDYRSHGAVQAAEVLEQAGAAYALTRNLLLAGCAGAAALAAVLALRMNPSFNRQLGGEAAEAVRVAHELAQGRLDVVVPCRPGDEHSLMAALQALRDQLVRTVGEVHRNAEGVAAASAQIAHGNQDLSRRTEQQASALQQTAASMDELGSTVRHNADNASQVDQLAKGASDVAIKGGEVVAQVVQTMRGIEDSSAKIADITNVIDGIAFQTNILALNAAVEAARAGESGRGFAVVAGEVRALAQRSAEAARQIKHLITDSVRRVGEGSTLADEAGRTMGEVVTAIQRVTDLMGQINAASAEQSRGVAQVGQAVAQMDHATGQNAALVDQSAAAACSLREQAQRLVLAVSVFRTAPSQPGRAPFAEADAAARAEAPALPAAQPAPQAAQHTRPARQEPAATRLGAQALLMPLMARPGAAVGASSLGGA